MTLHAISFKCDRFGCQNVSKPMHFSHSPSQEEIQSYFNKSNYHHINLGQGMTRTICGECERELVQLLTATPPTKRDTK